MVLTSLKGNEILQDGGGQLFKLEPISAVGNEKLITNHDDITSNMNGLKLRGDEVLEDEFGNQYRLEALRGGVASSHPPHKSYVVGSRAASEHAGFTSMQRASRQRAVTPAVIRRARSHSDERNARNRVYRQKPQQQQQTQQTRNVLEHTASGYAIVRKRAERAAPAAATATVDRRSQSPLSLQRRQQLAENGVTLEHNSVTRMMDADQRRRFLSLPPVVRTHSGKELQRKQTAVTADGNKNARRSAAAAPKTSGGLGETQEAVELSRPSSSHEQMRRTEKYVASTPPVQQFNGVHSEPMPPVIMTMPINQQGTIVTGPAVTSDQIGNNTHVHTYGVPIEKEPLYNTMSRPAAPMSSSHDRAMKVNGVSEFDLMHTSKVTGSPIPPHTNGAASDATMMRGRDMTPAAASFTASVHNPSGVVQINEQTGLNITTNNYSNGDTYYNNNESHPSQGVSNLSSAKKYVHTIPL